MNNLTFGERLWCLRTDEGLSQIELARRIGVQQRRISTWECGAHVPRLDEAVKLARLFEVSLDWLAGRVE